MRNAPDIQARLSKLNKNWVETVRAQGKALLANDPVEQAKQSAKLERIYAMMETLRWVVDDVQCPNCENPLQVNEEETLARSRTAYSCSNCGQLYFYDAMGRLDFAGTANDDGILPYQ